MDASSVLRVLVAGGRSVNSPHILSRLRFRPAHAHMLLTSSQTMATTRALSRPISGTATHSEYDALYPLGAAAVQGVLPRLKFGESPPLRVTITAGSTIVTMPALPVRASVRCRPWGTLSARDAVRFDAPTRLGGAKKCRRIQMWPEIAHTRGVGLN
jgi:hypothetical protein